MLMFPLPKIDYKDWIKSFLFAVLFALVFRAFLYEPYKIPSGSMYPNFKIGDFLFISKYKYGYSKHSIYGLPLLKKRILFSEPKRGDVIVFKSPNNDNINFIKRLIGLPGDKIQMQKGILYINNKPVQKKLIKQQHYIDPHKKEYIYEVFEETLPNGLKYKIWDANFRNHMFFPDDTRVYEVPEDHYFFLGDNRNNSTDSRFASMGFIHADKLLGRAEFLFWNSEAPLDEIINNERLYKLFKYQDRL